MATIKANENNDLKYRQGLINPNSTLSDTSGKKKDEKGINVGMVEGGNNLYDELEYFTE